MDWGLVGIIGLLVILYLFLGFATVFIATLMGEPVAETASGEMGAVILWPALVVLIVLLAIFDWWDYTAWPALRSKLEGGRGVVLLPSQAAKASQARLEKVRAAREQKNKLHVLEASDEDLHD